MNISAKKANKILEHLALQQATEGAQRGMYHGSLICLLPVGSWQADIIRKTPGIAQAQTPMELRQMMGMPDVSVIFLSSDAVVTRDVIERICKESALNKTVIWEAD